MSENLPDAGTALLLPAHVWQRSYWTIQIEAPAVCVVQVAVAGLQRRWQALGLAGAVIQLAIKMADV